jgi:hypothetical protein
MNTQIITILYDAVVADADKAAISWLDDSLLKIKQSDDPENDVCIFSAMARRKLGHGHISTETRLETQDGVIEIEGWEVGIAARIVLILTATLQYPDQSIKLVNAVYRFGDETERASITHSLSLYPDNHLLKPLALESGRTNSQLLYSALALNNPYPSAHYSEHEYNQLVMKSLFTGLKIENIYGLEKRANQELSRMCEDYIRERLDAHRPVPSDIWLALTPFASNNGDALLMAYMEDDDDGHRHYSALSIARMQSTSNRRVIENLNKKIEKRISLEKNPQILDILHNQIAI